MPSTTISLILCYMTAQKRKILLSIPISGLIIMLYALIFQQSGMSAEVSGDVSRSVVESMVLMLEDTFSIDLPFNDSPEQIERLNHFVRKSGHFFVYALMGLLVHSLALVWEQRGKGGLIVSWLVVIVMAAADEWHQYFIPGRSAQVSDVLLDAAGAIFGMLVLRLIHGLFVSRQNPAHVSRKRRA